MRIRSNIPEVLARFRRLEAEIPIAINRAIAPAYWKPRLEAVALRTLKLFWHQERRLAVRMTYERITPRIIATIEAMTFEGGSLFTMSMPGYGLPAAPIDVTGAAQFNQQTRTATGRPATNVRLAPETMRAGAANAEKAREAILQWVQEEKHKDERDAGLTDEEIAERLQWILGLHPRSSPRDRTVAMEAAGVALAKRIQEFISTGGMKEKTPDISPEIATQMLAAVLAAWKTMLVAGLPSMIDLQLTKAFQSVKGTMI